MPTPTVEDLLGDHLVSFWHAADASGVGEGGSIGTWTDRKNGLDAVQAVESQKPLYRGNYLSSGKPAVEFDGVNDTLKCVDASLSLPDGVMILCVLNINVNTPNATLFCFGDDLSSYMRLRCLSGGVQLQHTNPNAEATASVLTSHSGPHVTSCWFASGCMKLDSAAECASNGYVDSVLADSTLNMGARIGLSQWFNGGLHALLVINTSVGWYRVLEAAVVLRDEFGESLKDTLPVAGSGSVGGFSASRVLNT